MSQTIDFQKKFSLGFLFGNVLLISMVLFFLYFLLSGFVCLQKTDCGRDSQNSAANAVGASSDSGSDSGSDFGSGSSENSGSDSGEISGESSTAAPFQLGDLGNAIRREKGFTYPETLADVERLAQQKGGWIAHPVLDSYSLASDYFNPGQPKLTPEEAGKLRNETPETNELIVDAFQRIPDRSGLKPPQDSPEVDYEQELYRHMPSDVGSFNPLFFNTTADLAAIRYTQTSLFNTHFDTLEYVGNADAIVSWESSADHMMDRIVIRDDLLWSDGKPLTAYDWEFSYHVIMSSTVPIFGIRSGTDLLMGVKAYDARTLVYFHQNATPISPQSISYYIIPKHIYEKSISEDPTLTRSPWHQKQEHDPVTSGPYVVEKHLPNTSIILRRRENYYVYQGKQVREKPFLKRIYFQISPDSATAFMQMKNGDLEVMGLMPEQWLTQATTDDFYQKNTKASSSCWTYFALWFNLAKECPFFQDLRVRKALSFAFDYDEMLKVHRKGLDTQCRGLYAETAPFFPKEANLPYLKQDYAQARALLKEAGWVDSDRDGLLDHEWNGTRIPFQFTILTSTAPESIELCNLFARCLRHLGIACSVQSMEFNVQCQREVEHKFQMFMGGWGGGDDPYSSQNIWGTGEGRNFISYSNPQVDELYRQGLREFDRPKRMELYKKIHVLIYEDYPCVWLFNRNTSAGFNKKLRGVGFDFSGSYLQETWKEKERK